MQSSQESLGEAAEGVRQENNHQASQEVPPLPTETEEMRVSKLMTQALGLDRENTARPNPSEVNVGLHVVEPSIDTTFNFFGASSETLGREPQLRSLAEQMYLLYSRGHRMQKEDLEKIDGIPMEVSNRDDIKYLLDEVFRSGNLWLYNHLTNALAANEQEGNLVFKLVVVGNWQDSEGPLNAKIKLKAYSGKDVKRSNKLFTIGGPIQL